MNYQDQLNPWVIHQLLPNLTQNTIARFRRRTEAEAYVKVMQQMRPNIQFVIAFDVNLSNSSGATKVAT
jgi:hypothetical protein